MTYPEKFKVNEIRFYGNDGVKVELATPSEADKRRVYDLWKWDIVGGVGDVTDIEHSPRSDIKIDINHHVNMGIGELDQYRRGVNISAPMMECVFLRDTEKALHNHIICPPPLKVCPDSAEELGRWLTGNTEMMKKYGYHSLIPIDIPDDVRILRDRNAIQLGPPRTDKEIIKPKLEKVFHRDCFRYEDDDRFPNRYRIFLSS